jgi:hypothetical protein
MPEPPQLSFTVQARRIDAHGSEARCKDATIPLDTDLAGNAQAFNPAELLLLHDHVYRFGTVFNTVAPGTELSGVLRRKNETP